MLPRLSVWAVMKLNQINDHLSNVLPRTAPPHNSGSTGEQKDHFEFLLISQTKTIGSKNIFPPARVKRD